jgi:hypothetical protein
MVQPKILALCPGITLKRRSKSDDAPHPEGRQTTVEIGADSAFSNLSSVG